MCARCLTLVAVCIVSTVSGQDEVKAVGDTASFRLTNINPPVTSIIWKHRNINGTVVKAIEWDDDGFIIPNPRFKGITTLDEKTGQITITKLTVEHSGVYTIDINSKEQEQRFKLEVLAPVPKPEIQIDSSNTNPDVVYLRCGYSETIIWKNSAGETLKGLKNHLPGEFLKVKNKRNLHSFYTCTLVNAMSEETSDPVYERDLFKADFWGFIIWTAVVSISMVFIMLFLFIPTCHDLFRQDLELEDSSASAHLKDIL